MKLTKELAIVSKHIEKWFIPTPVNVDNVRYFQYLILFILIDYLHKIILGIY